EEYAARVDVIADVGGFGVAALAIPLTAWFVRRDRNQRVQQEALEESEERFRSLVQEGADLILILDTEGIVRYAAPSAVRVLGRGLGEIVGSNVFELLTGDDAQARRHVEKVFREKDGKITRELRAPRSNGSSILLETTFSNMLTNPGVGGIVVNGRNVTERREAEETLRDSEERYRALYEDNPRKGGHQALEEIKVDPGLKRYRWWS
ncbi:MAG: PAS domain S-box protein, partial [Actinomycetota bacterium]|nr:PAS domain S-box protein [Actinomycetota bacterium]